MTAVHCSVSSTVAVLDIKMFFGDIMSGSVGDDKGLIVLWDSCVRLGFCEINQGCFEVMFLVLAGT